MEKASGMRYPRILLSNTNESVKEMIWLIGLGALVVVMHSYLRIPMHLPGHHGIEWMALLILGRLTTKNKFSASISSLTASGMSIIPMMGFHDPFIYLTFFVPGVIIDIGYHAIKKLTAYRYFFLSTLTLTAGIAHITKPLIRWGISVYFHWPYGSFLYGVLYPTVTHFIFGIIGGLFGIIIFVLPKKK